MGHWAQIDNEGFVAQVVVADDDMQAWLETAIGGTWVQTSYNTFGGVHYSIDENGERVVSDDQSKALRFNYAGISYTYDETRDAFIPPKPFDSWVLDEDTCLWEAPTPRPTEGQWEWDEPTQSWVEVTE